MLQRTDGRLWIAGRHHRPAGGQLKIDLLAAVTTTVSTFDPSVFDAPLDQLAADLAPDRRGAMVARLGWYHS